MDGLSVAASALQVAGYCAQCTMKIYKWVGEVRSVDQRIASFCEGIKALESTFEGLDKTLKMPSMAKAAKSATETSDGRHLWLQLETALREALKTMARVNMVLDEINGAHGIGRRIKKQLQESLNSGELARLHRKIEIYNNATCLPIQMMTLSLQLEQRDLNVDSQNQLNAKLAELERSITSLASSLESLDRTTDSATLVGSSQNEPGLSEDVKKTISFTRQFLASASQAASVRSATSARSAPVGASRMADPAPMYTPRELPAKNEPGPQEQKTRIEGWISKQNLSVSPPPKRPTQKQSIDSGSESSSTEDDTDMSFRLARRHLVNGYAKTEEGNQAAAERCFRKVLTLLEFHDFGDQISHQPADVVLMLAESCMKQEKFDEAIELLGPVAERSADIFPKCGEPSRVTSAPRPLKQKPNRLQALAASHMLGEVFLSKDQPDQAEPHGLKAFKGRKKYLGEQQAKTLESVQLMIDIYKALGDDEEAEAYEEFLSPPASPASPDDDAGHKIPDGNKISGLDAIRQSVPTPRVISPRSSQEPYLQAAAQPARRSITSRLPWMGKPSPTNVHSAPQNISRRTTVDETHLSSDPFAHPHMTTPHDRRFSSLSSPSTIDRTSSNADDTLPTTDSLSIHRSPSTKNLEPIYSAIRELCTEGNYSKAVKRATSFMEPYDRDSLLLLRKDDIKENIKKGGKLGLASSGKGYAPIHFFVELKHTEAVDEIDLLIKHSVNPNAITYKAGFPGRDPLTPLQIATRENHKTIVKLLLSCPEIKTDVKDFDGYTPLLLACRKSYYNIVEQLLSHWSFRRDIPLDLPNTWYGNSLLHDAARQCDSTLVGILMRHGSMDDINRQDKFGKTPLMHAVLKKDIMNVGERTDKSSRRMGTVLLLVGCKADITVRDEKGWTAGDYARVEGWVEGVEILDGGN